MSHDVLYWIRFGVITVVFVTVIGCCGYASIQHCKKQEQILEEDIFRDVV